MYTSSAELHTWCEQNRNRLYIPEWLLEEWGITVDQNFFGAAAWPPQHPNTVGCGYVPTVSAGIFEASALLHGELFWCCTEDSPKGRSMERGVKNQQNPGWTVEQGKRREPKTPQGRPKNQPHLLYIEDTQNPTPVHAKPAPAREWYRFPAVHGLPFILVIWWRPRQTAKIQAGERLWRSC